MLFVRLSGSHMVECCITLVIKMAPGGYVLETSHKFYHKKTRCCDTMGTL